MFPGQCQSKGQKRRKKEFHFWSMKCWRGILGGSTLLCCQLLPVLFSWIWRSPGLVKDSMSGRAFFSSEMHFQALSPWSLAAIWVVTRTWSASQGDPRAVFVLGDSKSEGWEKSGNIRLESRSQIFEETRIIQEPVQLRAEPQRQLRGLESKQTKG